MDPPFIPSPPRYLPWVFIARYNSATLHLAGVCWIFHYHALALSARREHREVSPVRIKPVFRWFNVACWQWKLKMNELSLAVAVSSAPPDGRRMLLSPMGMPSQMEAPGRLERVPVEVSTFDYSAVLNTYWGLRLSSVSAHARDSKYVPLSPLAPSPFSILIS